MSNAIVKTEQNAMAELEASFQPLPVTTRQPNGLECRFVEKTDRELRLEGFNRKARHSILSGQVAYAAAKAHQAVDLFASKGLTADSARWTVAKGGSERATIKFLKVGEAPKKKETVAKLETALEAANRKAASLEAQIAALMAAMPVAKVAEPVAEEPAVEGERAQPAE